MGGKPADQGGTRETERKFEAPDCLDLSDPGSAFGLGVGRHDEVELDATYYDTEDLRLARAGLTLRRRVGGDDAGWHLKLPVDADTREEIRRPLGQQTRPPEALVALTRVYTRGARLDPVAKLVTRRRRWGLVDPQGEELAELAEDRVHGIALHPSPGELNWRELEVELTGPAPAGLLDSIEQELRSYGARRSSAPSKLSRVLGDRLPARSGGSDEGKRRKLTSAQVVLGYVSEKVDVLRAHDPLVRLETPDAVHRMRVSARRVRSILQGYRRVLDREATRELVEDLRWLGGELAPARDAEVTSARFQEAVDALPPEVVLGPVSAELTRRFAREQAGGQRRAVAALDSDRYLLLQERLDALLSEPPTTGARSTSSSRDLSRAVRKAHRRTARRMETAAAAAPGHDRDGSLHEARKAAKRLRYVLEAAEPALGKKAKRLRKRVKGVQSILGDHHDAVVARPVLRELGGRARLDGANGFTFGVLHGLEQDRADRLEAEMVSAWERVTLPKKL